MFSFPFLVSNSALGNQLWYILVCVSLGTNELYQVLNKWSDDGVVDVFIVSFLLVSYFTISLMQGIILIFISPGYEKSTAVAKYSWIFPLEILIFPDPSSKSIS